MTLTILNSQTQVHRDPGCTLIENATLRSEPEAVEIPTQPGSLILNENNLVFFSDISGTGIQLTYKSIIMHAKSMKFSKLDQEPQSEEKPGRSQSEENVRQLGDCIYCQLDFALPHKNTEFDTIEDIDTFTELFIYANNEETIDTIYHKLSYAISLIPPSDCSDSDEIGHNGYSRLGSDDDSHVYKHCIPNGTSASASDQQFVDSPITQLSGLNTTDSELFYSAGDVDKLSNQGKKTLDRLNKLLAEQQ